MSSFTEFSAQLQIQYDSVASAILGKDHWRVCKSFRFYLDATDPSRWVYVPAGYLTDGASVPRPLWGIIPPWGNHGQAAVVHDIVCEYLSVTDHSVPVAVTRAECDKILLTAMTVLKVNPVKRNIMYGLVCLFRVISRTDSPTTTQLKRSLEASWVPNRGE